MDEQYFDGQSRITPETIEDPLSSFLAVLKFIKDRFSHLSSIQGDVAYLAQSQLKRQELESVVRLENAVLNVGRLVGVLSIFSDDLVNEVSWEEFKQKWVALEIKLGQEADRLFNDPNGVSRWGGNPVEVKNAQDIVRQELLNITDGFNGAWNKVQGYRESLSQSIKDEYASLPDPVEILRKITFLNGLEDEEWKAFQRVVPSLEDKPFEGLRGFKITVFSGMIRGIVMANPSILGEASTLKLGFVVDAIVEEALEASFERLQVSKLVEMTKYIDSPLLEHLKSIPSVEELKEQLKNPLPTFCGPHPKACAQRGGFRFKYLPHGKVIHESVK